MEDYFEDYSKQISRRKIKLSNEKLSRCVTADTLVDEGLRQVYIELNGDSCLGRNWTKLAGKLLKPPPTSATFEFLSQSNNKAYELLKTWAQSDGPTKTFDLLIETMVECKLYSACDELLDFLQTSTFDSQEHHGCLNQIVNDVSDGFQQNPASSHQNQHRLGEDLDQIVSVEDLSDEASHQDTNERSTSLQLEESQEELNQVVPVENLSVENSEFQQNATSRRKNERQPAENCKRPRNHNGRSALRRSKSCPAGQGWFSKILNKIFRRSISSPSEVDSPDQVPDTPTPSPPTKEDEIFIVSSNSDNETQGMKDLMSFVKGLKPVKKGELAVKTIHDVDQGGQVTTAWLVERVNRARYVILCFSSSMQAITDQGPHMPQFRHQNDYNLQFTMDFLVTGTIYESGCRNPGGKFIPVLLDGHDRSTIVVSLRHFQNFCWPDERERMMKYIMNLPEYPVPRQGSPKRLVRKEIAC